MHSSADKETTHLSTEPLDASLLPSVWEDQRLCTLRVDMSEVVKEERLAAGMFGEVWRARYGNELVALKQLKDNDAERDVIQAFAEEIKLLATLSHENIVRFVGVAWTKESDLSVLTEFMGRGDLRSYLDSKRMDGSSGWLTYASHVDMAINVADALVYLHSFAPPLIHRDLKSRNVLLDDRGVAKVSDFGISRRCAEAEATTMTACVGTIRWTAPEVLAGGRYNESCDIYSFGMILNELDTHLVPFANEYGEGSAENGELTDAAIGNLVMTGSLTARFTSRCPSSVVALARSCCAFDPLERPSAAAVSTALRSYCLNHA